MYATESQFPAPHAQEFSLVHLLEQRAHRQPHAVALTFLIDEAGREDRITYGELARRARSIAAHLQSLDARGERALLLYPPGLDYICALFGCMYADVIAVPAYPPDPTRLERTLPRLSAIASDCGATVALTTSSILPMAEYMAGRDEAFKSVRWLATDTITTDHQSWREPTLPNAIAFLQYTSGSTSSPKGVQVTHANLQHNLGQIQIAFGHSVSSRGVIWLPPYHDMGLIGGILQPIYVGFPVVLFSPLDFLRNPIQWLQAITRYKATTSGGPNFAYDLCVRKVTEAQLRELDLSSWSVAFNGAEPIHPETLERFARKFAPCDFEPSAFYPCYGLAEATLIVSGGLPQRGAHSESFDPGALGRNEVLASTQAEARVLVGCGSAFSEQRIEVVDPVELKRCSADRVGEIWVSGGSVATGYWGRSEETASTFNAFIADTGEGPFLRTGDLGFLRDGQLYVTGRIKDLIVIRGRNHYPQDIERTVETTCPDAIRKGCVAAFSIELEGQERLIVAFEIERRQASHSDQNNMFDAERAAAQIRQAVASQHGVQVHAVVVLEPGSLPKTSSGKLQRQATRRAYLDDSLQQTAVRVVTPDASTSSPSVEPITVVEKPVDDEPSSRVSFLREQVAQALGIASHRLRASDSVASLGLDSMAAIEVAHAIEKKLGVAIPVDVFFRDITIEQLAEVAFSKGADPAPPLIRVERDGKPFPLSFAQERLWFLNALDGDNAAWNIAAAVRIRGALDESALEYAFKLLIRRHEPLRSLVVANEGLPLQVVQDPASWTMARTDVSASPNVDIAASEASDAELRRAFDLTSELPIRVRLIRQAHDRHLLAIVVHHIASDGWSMGVIVHEVSSFYNAFVRGDGATLARASLDYADYVAWEKEWSRTPNFQASIDYWKNVLDDAPPTLELPTDRARPAVLSARGADVRFALDDSLSRRINDFSKATGVTPFMTLLAAFKVVLCRYSGQRDLVVGTPTANRDRAELKNLVGLFVNTLAIRTRLDKRRSFEALVLQVKENCLAAYKHQGAPFEKVVEALQLKRDPKQNPVFQVMFALQNTPLPSIQLDRLDVERVPVDLATSMVDLKLEIVPSGSAFEARLEYSTDLFDSCTIERIAAHFKRLLESVLETPTESLAQLDYLSPAEKQLLSEWNDTDVEYPGDRCIHELFEAQAARSPDTVAVEFGGDRLTYRELDERANQLAHYLTEQGVGPEVCVGLRLERSLDMMVSLLGVLKAGGAYVPIDPNYPQERIDYMLDDSRAKLVVTPKWWDEHRGSIEARPRDTRPSVSHTSNLAYVIYTSGSTGNPKGVGVLHQGVVNFLRAMQRAPGIRSQDRIVAVTTLSFDIAVLELFLPLTVGARVVIASSAQASDGQELSQLLDRVQATMMQATPATWRLLLDANWRGKGDLRVLCGGEALSERLAARLAGCTYEVWNVYGPTEATVWASRWKVERGQPIVLGRPIENTQFYVVDGDLCPVPQGVAGELLIGGEQVARGYFNRADLTADKFIPNAWGRAPGARVYRTGDVVRQRADGTVEYLGRIDHQVKIRGFRIELGEIESALERHPGVRQAVVVTREDNAGDKRLVGYVVGREGSARPGASELKAHLRDCLPTYMVPNAYVFVTELPLTPNGKVDRKKLPAPELALERGYLPPRSMHEKALCDIWREVLGVERVGIEDNFFDLGGHSLSAMQVVSRVASMLSQSVPVRVLFEKPTLREFAEHLRAAERSSLPPLEKLNQETAQVLSYGQERLWFLWKLDPTTAAYHMAGGVKLEGTLDEGKLREAFDRLSQRHDSLRTCFVEHDGEVRAVLREAIGEVLRVEHCEGFSEERLQERAQELSNQEFDLGQGPLWRAHLLRVSEAEHRLVFVTHHIVSDGWSIGILIQEVGELYGALTEGHPPHFRELPFTYAEFAAWQKRHVSEQYLSEHIAYWEQKLRGAPRLDLRGDRARPQKRSGRGRQLSVQVSGAVRRAVQELARRLSATEYMVLLSAWKMLLFRYSGQHDIVLGTPLAGRTRSELEGVLGFFVQTLVMRTEVEPGLTFESLVGRVKQTSLEAFQHQDAPFEKVIDALGLERDLSRSPLVDVLFAFQNTPESHLTLGDLKLTSWELERKASQFDLTLDISHSEDGYVARFEYSTDLWDSSTIERMARHFTCLLQAALEAPTKPLAQLDYLSPQETKQLLEEWNDTHVDYPKDKCVHRLFEEQAERNPDAVAVVFERQQLSYKELNERANRLAHLLQAQGVGTESRVAILLERSFDMVVALLATLKAGAAYVPIDTDYPQERIDYMLDDAKPTVVITRDWLAQQTHAIDSCPTHNPLASVATQHLAYIIYTSGSTGNPKGVMIPHGHVARLMTATEGWFHFGPGDTWTVFHSYAFDFSVWELWGALCTGGRAIVVPYLVSRSPADFYNLLKTERVTVLNQTPSAFRQLIATAQEDDARNPLFLRFVIFGGEALDLASLKPWFERFGDSSPALINMYGITETTVHVTYRPIKVSDTSAGRSLIGRQIDDLQIYLLDSRGQLVPVGVPGEIHVGGAGVARGYLNRPELTAERFIPNPFGGDGARLYRSGDLARRLPSGELEYLGRIDHQVKIRGFRIELGEIESALEGHPAVRQALVIAREDQAGDKRLVAYVVANDDNAPSFYQLRDLLRASLPDYMVPSAFVILDHVPLTSNGKVDRKALPAPEFVSERAFIAPRSSLEHQMASIWSELLGVERIGIDDDFFELGGHSLLAMRFVGRVRSTLGIEFSVRDLFETPTLRHLAALAQDAYTGPTAGASIKPRADRHSPAPMSSSQERLFQSEQRRGEGGVFNMPMAFRLRGNLDGQLLFHVMDRAIRRHEVLRTTFAIEDGKHVQIVHDTLEPERLSLDLSEFPALEREQELRRVLLDQATRRFDLIRGPLIRQVLVRVSTEEHIWMCVMHHIIFDGGSMGILAREIATVYAAEVSGTKLSLPEPTLQYSDYSVWERESVTAESMREHLAYWKEKLRGSPALELPTDHPRPPVEILKGARLPCHIDREQTETLRVVGQQHGASLFAVVLALFKVLLSKHSQQTDISVATPSAHRQRSELEPLLGFFVNPIVLRTDLAGSSSFAELLEQVKGTIKDALAHADASFEKVVEAVGPKPDPSRCPLVQAQLALLPNQSDQFALPGIVATPLDIPTGTTKLDLTLAFDETSEGLRGTVEYNTTLFEQATIEMMIEDLRKLVSEVTRHPTRNLEDLGSWIKDRRKSNRSGG